MIGIFYFKQSRASLVLLILALFCFLNANITTAYAKQNEVEYHPQKQIFRSYDIRGVYNKELFDKDAYLIGRAFGTILKSRNLSTIAVGYDGRSSSISLHDNLVKGLVEAGCDVIELGLVSTPVVYFSEYLLSLDASIMVTASHNPHEYNGFKFTLQKDSFCGNDIDTLFSLIVSQKFSTGRGSIVSKNIKDAYITRLLKDANIKSITQKDPKIVWDIGNGATSEFVKALVKKLPGQHVLLHDKIDPYFSDRGSDPAAKNSLTALSSLVKSRKFDAGIAFDGDGDRIVVVNSDGRVLRGDELLVVFADNLLTSHKGSKVIVDVKTSDSVVQAIKSLGGKPIMSRIGHDDALYNAVRFLNIISQKNYTIDTVLKSIPITYAAEDIAVACSNQNKFKIIEDVKTYLKQQNIKFNDLDGVRVEMKGGGWWLLRASQTTEILMIFGEAPSLEQKLVVEKEMQFIKNNFLAAKK